MPYNGSGVFTLNYNWENDAANAIPITASRMDAQESDIANGLSTVITSTGQSTVTANIPMSGFKLTGLGSPTVSGDAIRYAGPAVLSDLTLTGTLTAPTVAGTTVFTGQITAPDTGVWNGSGIVGTVAQFNTMAVGGSLATTTKFSLKYDSATTNPLTFINASGGGVRWDIGDGVNSAGSTFGFSVSGVGPVLRLAASGALQFPVYGAGTLTTDASGNVSAASDPSLKEKIAEFSGGLSEILAVAANPKYTGNFRWLKASGMETEGTYTSFFAYDDFPISEAISRTKAGTNNFSDRPVIMALVNAVAELAARVEALEAK